MKNLCVSLLLWLTWACPAWADPTPSLPYYKTIMEIMAPLEYSGVPVMVEPQVSLSVNFAQRTWILRNIHAYDRNGNIVLAHGRFGLCAELATYLFEKMEPFLDKKHYDIKFAMVDEPDFFSGHSNHIVLLLVDKSDGQIFLIDPSFHKYGRLKDLPEYKVLNLQDTLTFVRDKSPDVSFNVDQAMPLYIKNDYLLSFAVTSIDGKFDKDNFILVVSVNRRHKFTGHDIVFIGRRNKEFEDLEDKALLHKILTQAEIDTLFDKLKIWLRNI